MFLLGGGVADAYPLVVVKSDTVRVSVLPVAGCKFPAVFLGKVAFDVVGLGVGPSCLRVDSEETLLTVIDERAQLAHAALGVTPVDSSEAGAPVPELRKISVLGEPLVDSLQEPMPAAERLKCAIQVTDLIWEPLEQVRYVVSGDVDFDSYGTAPWNAGGIYVNVCQLRETLRTMMLQWLIRMLCRPVIWNANGRSARNVLVAPSQETVHIVVNIFRWIWASTLLFTTWNLRSCGAARLCGVRYGRGLLRTVLIICGVHTRCRYQSKR